MAKFRELPNRSQISLLPRTVDEYVDEDDLVRYVDSLVDEFDLRAIESDYDAIGRPAYRPQVLVKLLVYGKLRGMNSARKICQAARENLRFIFLCSEEKPDFRTLSDFRKRHHKELAKLLTQTISIGIKEKIIKLDCVSIDGTKLKSWSGKKSFKDVSNIKHELENLELELSKSIAADITNDAAEENTPEDIQESKLPRGLKEKAARAKKLREALASHREMAGSEKPKHVSLTDPESRFMKGNGCIHPSYNAQAAVDTASMMVVGGYAHNACCDSSELAEVVEDVKARTSQQPISVVADKGYCNLETLAEVEEQGIEVYVPLTNGAAPDVPTGFVYNAETDSFVCSQGRELKQRGNVKRVKRYRSTNCEGCPIAQECLKNKGAKVRCISRSNYFDTITTIRKRATTAVGQVMRRVRACTIEPIFGLIKQGLRCRQLTVRTKERANSEWQLTLAVVNILKLSKIRMEAAKVSG